MKTVVYFVDSQVMGGNEQALLQLIAGIDRRQWRPVLFHRPEPGLALLIERVHELDVRTQVVPWLRDWRGPAQLAGMVRLLRAENPAVFHASLHWPTACRAGFLAAALARVPAIIATVQLFSGRRWGRGLVLQQRLAATQIDRFIAVSNAIAAHLDGVFRIPQGKIRVVHNSVELDRFNCPPDAARREAHPPIVLTVGRLDHQKGQTYLLEAAARLPEARFVLAGDGPDRTVLEEQAQRLNIADRVDFLGYRQDIPDLLAGCDVFVLPSLYEGLPLSVLEAMAAGKPVIATAIAGTDEAVTDRVTGILVPPRQPRPLAEAIRELVDDPRLAQRLANAGRARVWESFSAEAMVRGVTQIYDEILLSRRPDARSERAARASA